MRNLDLWINKYETRSKQIGQEIKNYAQWLNTLKEDLMCLGLIQPPPVGEKKQYKACYVDGGEGLYELLGTAVYIVRAAGLIHEKPQARFIRDLDFDIIRHSDDTKEQVELKRECMEIKIAEEAVNAGCDLIVLDGSLFVKNHKKPAQTKQYDAYLKKFNRLMKKCREKNASLVGVSEDTKSRLLINYLMQEHEIDIPVNLTDASLLRLLAGDSSFLSGPFKPKTNQLTAADYPTVYLQPTRLSNPLRIDFPPWEQNLEKILSHLQFHSNASKAYGYPLPLYLAHLESRINPQHVKWTSKHLAKAAFREYPQICDAYMRTTRRNCRPGN
ncbi:MAG: hypothetical protein GF334_11575 [Candidatus Altiarchaeales archaeon]|nr:hypothetical protein [Candidatus Altiarchaeales archaeon]